MLLSSCSSCKCSCQLAQVAWPWSGVLRKQRRCVRFLATNRKSFVDEHPDQPAAKRSFVFEPRRIPRCPLPAVVDGVVGSPGTTENSTGDKVLQAVEAPESRVKYSRVFYKTAGTYEIVRHHVSQYPI